MTKTIRCCPATFVGDASSPPHARNRVFLDIAIIRAYLLRVTVYNLAATVDII